MSPSTSAAKQGESITVKVTPPGSVMTIPGPAEVQVIVTSSAPTPHAGSNPGTPVFPEGGGLPQPAGFSWQEPLHPGTDFEYRFPEETEEYTNVHEAKIALHSKVYAVRAGFAERDNRGRLVVFFGREALAEFVETVDGQGFASLIRPDGRKTLRPTDFPPALYQQARLENYRDAVGMTGKGFPKSMALVIGKDDLPAAVYHAAARWLAKRGYPVEPAT